MNELEKAFSQLYGKPCWNVKKGVGSFLTFEFGGANLHIHEPTPRRMKRLVVVHGEWHLWVYCCNWKYYNNEQVMGHDKSSKKEIEKIAKDLDGQALIKAKVTYNETNLEFDLGGRLVLTSNQTDYEKREETEQWMLFTPNEKVYTFRADGKFSYHPSDDNSAENWYPLRVGENSLT